MSEADFQNVQFLFLCVSYLFLALISIGIGGLLVAVVAEFRDMYVRARQYSGRRFR